MCILDEPVGLKFYEISFIGFKFSNSSYFFWNMYSSLCERNSVTILKFLIIGDLIRSFKNYYRKCIKLSKLVEIVHVFIKKIHVIYELFLY